MCRQIFWRNQKTNKSKNIVWWLFGVVACRIGLVWEVSKRWIRNGLSRVWDCVHFFRHEFTLTIFPYYKFSKFYSIKLKEIHELCIWLRVSESESRNECMPLTEILLFVNFFSHVFSLDLTYKCCRRFAKDVCHFSFRSLILIFA